MRVAFFVTHFPRLSETFVLNQITGLIERGCDVEVYAREVLTVADSHEWQERYGLRERTWRRRSLPRRPWRRVLGGLRLAAGLVPRHPAVVARSFDVLHRWRPAVSMELIDQVSCLVDRGPFDIVHCHFGLNGLDAALLKEVGALRGCLVTTFHGDDIRVGLAAGPTHYARLVRACDAVHSISAYNTRHLLAFGFAADQIVRHPMGIDVERFRPAAGRSAGTADEPLTLLTVARLAPEKGIETALLAVAEIRRRRPGVVLEYRVVGGGPCEERLASLTTALGLDDVVHLVGPCDQEDVAIELQGADLFLLPSLAEALPVSIMEAMGCGLPVVATEVGSVAELVAADTGRLVAPGDADAIAGAVLDLLAVRETWPELGASARRIIVESHDIERLNDRLIEHYRSLIDRAQG